MAERPQFADAIQKRHWTKRAGGVMHGRYELPVLRQPLQLQGIGTIICNADTGDIALGKVRKKFRHLRFGRLAIHFKYKRVCQRQCREAHQPPCAFANHFMCAGATR